ncbi:fatty acid-binding protein, liver [Hyalella azteca]|uniref:Fatty acid-binding protein, liver n=1 Tax=Hyalella azteca TaxID=294128 RepID=A0A8B7P8E1_HYAAZ|nr:fatty acid-binding protein, liver [Hyalella azteca]
MSVTGTFVLSSNENYEAWLQAAGIPADTATRLAAAKPTLEVTKGDNTVTVKTTSGDKVFSNTVTYGQDSEADIAGLKYFVNAEPTSNGYKGTIKLGSKTGTISVENNATGFVQTTTIEGVTAKRFYTKQ